MGLTFRLGQVPLAIFTDSSNNVGIGASANASYKLQVTGATNLTGALTGTSASFSSFVYVLGGNPLRIYNTGNGDFGNLTFATATGFTFDKGATFSSSVTASGSIFIGTNFAQLLPISALNSQFLTGSYYDGSNVIATAASGTRTIYNSGGFDFRNFTGATIGSSVTDTSRMVITSGGTIGIGTTDLPYGQLTIKSNTSTSYGGLNVFANANNNFIALNHTGSLGIIETEYSTGGAATPIAFVTSGGERMRITTSGKVGIGATSVVAALQVYSPRIASFTTQSPNHLYLQSEGYSGSGLNTIDFGSTSYGVPLARIGVEISGDGTYIRFGTSNAYATGITNTGMTITPDGQVQIKQNGNTFVHGIRLINTGNQYWGFVSGGDTNLYLGYNSPSASIGVFNSSTGVYTAQSDFNKKKDFEQSNIGLNAILGLKPTLYRMKSDETAVEKHLGFIAQEVKEFIPQAYSESTNGDNTFIGLTEMPIIAALVKAVQELEARIKQLENK